MTRRFLLGGLSTLRFLLAWFSHSLSSAVKPARHASLTSEEIPPEDEPVREFFSVRADHLSGLEACSSS